MINILDKIKSLPSIFEEPPSPARTNVKEDDISSDIESTTTDVVSTTLRPSRKETGDSYGSSQTGDEKQSSSFVLDNGFDLKKNNYTKNARDGAKVELPPPRRITSEDSLMNDSESIGDFSQVEVIFSLLDLRYLMDVFKVEVQNGHKTFSSNHFLIYYKIRMRFFTTFFYTFSNRKIIF